MASVFELAKLSSMAYDSTKTIFQNWVQKRNFGIPSGKGFYAELYFNTKKKEAAYVIRGTDTGGDWADYLSDLQVGMGQVPDQFTRAAKGFEESKQMAKGVFLDDYKIYLTGHSLGGGLASLLSAKHGGLPTVTFNAPGMMMSYVHSYGFTIIGLVKLAKLDASKILHMRATGDPVSIATGRHMGRVKDVYVDEWGDHNILGASRYLAQHSIENMVKTLSKYSQYQTELS